MQQRWEDGGVENREVEFKVNGVTRRKAIRFSAAVFLMRECIRPSRRRIKICDANRASLCLSLSFIPPTYDFSRPFRFQDDLVLAIFCTKIPT